MAARVRRYLTIDGETKSLAEWSLEKGIPLSTLAWRVSNGVPSGRLFVSPWMGREHAAKNELWAGANHQPYEDDPMAQACVSEFRDGMTLDQIGLCLGVTFSRVEQLEREALRKLRKALAAEGKERAFIEWLRERDTETRMEEAG